MEFLMPKMDHTSEEAMIVEWLVREGEPFSEGDTILKIETGKCVLEVPAPYSGKIGTFTAKENETVPVLTPIAIIEGI